jgi:hypothetical protein
MTTVDRILTTMAASNSDHVIVENTDPTKVSHRLTSNGATIGVSDLGGGYINHFDFGDGTNVVEARYGRGWQVAIRDGLHKDRHNPTQAGTLDPMGARVDVEGPSDVEGSGQRLTVPRFNVALYRDGVNDFIENEDAFPERYNLGPGDRDSIDETGKTMDDELRSEFDYGGFYEDVAAKFDADSPVFRHVYSFEYRRDPGPPYESGEQPEKYSPMQQFGADATMDGRPKNDGEYVPVIDETRRASDVAPQLEGEHQATNVDYSMVQDTWGIRIKPRSFNHCLWVDDGEWQSFKLTDEGRIEVTFEETNHIDNFPEIDSHPAGNASSDRNLAVLTEGADPDSGRSVGMYIPESSPLNRTPIAGVDKETGEVQYRHDRRVKRIILSNMRIGVFPLMVERHWLTGMLAPRYAPEGIVERLTKDLYVLVGTPNEIREVAPAIDEAY